MPPLGWPFCILTTCPENRNIHAHALRAFFADSYSGDKEWWTLHLVTDFGEGGVLTTCDADGSAVKYASRSLMLLH